MAKKATTPAAPKPVEGFNADSSDAYLVAIDVGFEIRAGLPTYERELQERLKDVEEETRKVFYVVPVKLSGDLYKKLLLATLNNPQEDPAWTEQNHLEQLVRDYV